MSWFVYVVTLAPGLDRDAVMRALESRGIPSRGYFAPLHRQPYLRDHPQAGTRFPVADAAATRTLALPFHNRMTEADVAQVVEALEASVADVARK